MRRLCSSGWSGLPSICVAMVVGGGLGCARHATPRDTIVVLIEAPVARLDPRFAASSWETRVSRLIAPGLTGLADMGMGTSQGLAVRLERKSDTVYEATLRPEARFPDGRAVEAADVVYTFDSVRDPLLGSPSRTVWTDILDRVEAIDAGRVRFVLRRPRAPFRTDLDFGIVDRLRAGPLDAQVRAAALAHRPAPAFDLLAEAGGAGPYRVVERSSDRVLLARNPYAWAPPRSDRIVIRAIRDDNSRVLAMMGRSADVTLNGITTPVVLETLAAQSHLQVLSHPSATLTYVGFNLQDPILADRRVRQAIAMAIDRRALIEAKLGGRAEIALSVLDGASGYVPEDLLAPTFDPAAARRLLDEAGHPDPDGDGPLPRFALEWKSSALRFRVALAQAMARQLAAVGIAVDVRPFDFATFLDDVKKGNFQLFTLQMSDIIEPDFLRTMFLSDRIPTAANNFSGNNRFRYRNREVDLWLNEGSQVSEPAARRVVYGYVQRALAQDLPMLPLWHEDNVAVASRDLQGFVVLRAGRLEGLLTAGKGP